jgi:hypothetical protein
MYVRFTHTEPILQEWEKMLRSSHAHLCGSAPLVWLALELHDLLHPVVLQLSHLWSTCLQYKTLPVR